MTLTIVVVAAVVTYLSRAVALALLPPARGGLLVFVERVPAPLFAGLAVLTLVGEDGLSQVAAPALAATLAALAVSPARSLAVTLVAGLAAFGLVSWLG